LRNEYLGAENRILRGQIKGRLLLSEGEKATLAEIAQRLGRKALEEFATVAKPDTLLACGWRIVLTISTYMKGCRESPLAKGLRALNYHQRAQMTIRHAFFSIW
jgi:hypothetical protein